MAATLQIGVIRAALKAALTGRAGLSGVSVNSFEPGEDDKRPEHIWFGAAEGQLQPAARQTRFDEFELPVVVMVLKPGDGDTVAASAENRALALVAEVESELVADHTIDGSALNAVVARYEIENRATPGNRLCEATVVLRIESELV